MSTPQDPFSPQPGWGPPPPGYGPPPGPPPGQPQWGGPAYGARPTNTLAIVSLVLIFVFTPAALVTGIIARRQIKQTGESGDGMALAGIICGALGIAFFVLLMAAVFAAFAIGSGIGIGTSESSVVPLRLILSAWA